MIVFTGRLPMRISAISVTFAEGTLGNIGLTPLCTFHRGKYGIHGLVKAQEKPGHIRRRDRNRTSCKDLFMEQRDNRTAGCQDITVPVRR